MQSRIPGFLTDSAYQGGSRAYGTPSTIYLFPFAFSHLCYRLNMTPNVARRAYSAEQLLALRDSASDEPLLKIETKAEDGAIKSTFARCDLAKAQSDHVACTSTFLPHSHVNVTKTKTLVDI